MEVRTMFFSAIAVLAVIFVVGLGVFYRDQLFTAAGLGSSSDYAKQIEALKEEIGAIEKVFRSDYKTYEQCVKIAPSMLPEHKVKSVACSIGLAAVLEKKEKELAELKIKLVAAEAAEKEAAAAKKTASALDSKNAECKLQERGPFNEATGQCYCTEWFRYDAATENKCIRKCASTESLQAVPGTQHTMCCPLTYKVVVKGSSYVCEKPSDSSEKEPPTNDATKKTETLVMKDSATDIIKNSNGTIGSFETGILKDSSIKDKVYTLPADSNVPTCAEGWKLSADKKDCERSCSATETGYKDSTGLVRLCCAEGMVISKPNSNVVSWFCSESTNDGTGDDPKDDPKKDSDDKKDDVKPPVCPAGAFARYDKATEKYSCELYCKTTELFTGLDKDTAKPICKAKASDDSKDKHADPNVLVCPYGFYSKLNTTLSKHECVFYCESSTQEFKGLDKVTKKPICVTPVKAADGATASPATKASVKTTPKVTATATPNAKVGTVAKTGFSLPIVSLIITLVVAASGIFILRKRRA